MDMFSDAGSTPAVSICCVAFQICNGISIVMFITWREDSYAVLNAKDRLTMIAGINSLRKVKYIFGGVAQLVRAFGSHPRGHGFEPPRLHIKSAFRFENADFFK